MTLDELFTLTARRPYVYSDIIDAYYIVWGVHLTSNIPYTFDHIYTDNILPIHAFRDTSGVDYLHPSDWQKGAIRITIHPDANLKEDDQILVALRVKRMYSGNDPTLPLQVFVYGSLIYNENIDDEENITVVIPSSTTDIYITICAARVGDVFGFRSATFYVI